MYNAPTRKGPVTMNRLRLCFFVLFLTVWCDFGWTYPQAKEGKTGSSKPKPAAKSAEGSEAEEQPWVIQGWLLDGKGAPVPAQVCLIVEGEGGKRFMPFSVPGGRLTPTTAKANAKGRFRMEVFGEWTTFRLCLCEELSPMDFKFGKLIGGEYKMDGAKKRIDLGKIVVD